MSNCALHAPLSVPHPLSSFNRLKTDALIPQVRAIEQSNSLFGILDANENRLLAAKRRSPVSALRQLAREFTEDLGLIKKAGKVEQWNSGAPLDPLR